MSLQLRELSYALGAEVTGVDIANPLNLTDVKNVRDAFLKHGILLFRGQHISSEQFVTFSRQFGELDDNKTRKTRDATHHEISRLINMPKPDGDFADTHYAGSDWHSDSSFKTAPTDISLLHAVEVPDVGGDTQFANMYLAYETLSDGMKALLQSLDGVHVQEEKLLDHSTPERLRESRRAKTIAHALVKVHPETSRKSLYVGDKVQLFAGMTAEESRPLIDFLCGHARRPQFIYRHQWQKNDVLMWDNRCTNHNALGNYDRRNKVRHMEKIATIGIETGRLYDDPAETRNLAQSYSLE